MSKKTFMQHKRLYYDATTDTWIKRRIVAESDELSVWDELGLVGFDTEPQQSEILEGAHSSADLPPPIIDFTEDAKEPDLSSAMEGKY